MTYDDFLSTKVPAAESAGFEPLSAPHESLFPHQRDICLWAIRGGRRAVFAAFGLGKTRQHIQIAKWVVEKEPGRKYLIVAPLGVRHVFTREDGPEMGAEIAYCRTDEEVQATTAPIIITNYERVRDGAITLSPEVFAGAGLDEASVLRSFGSKTYQTFLGLFRAIPYRFVFTATPSPNRHKELIHYGGFLGVMDTGEALTRFFRRDSSQANNLTLYPHMEERFWLWLSSWAVFLQRPSDLGYDDAGYDLPALHVHWHMVAVDHTKAWQSADSWGQSQLFLDQTSGLKEVAAAKRETMEGRLAKAMEIMGEQGECPEDLRAAVEEAKTAGLNSVAAIQRHFRIGYMRAARILAAVRQRHWLLWHDLEAERELIEDRIPAARTVYGSQDLEEREELIVGFGAGAFPILATKPIIAGSGCNFQHHCADAIFLGSTYKFNDFIQAVHRIYRFQQQREVNIHVIFAESEAPVVETLKAKWRQHNELVAKMSDLLRRYRLTIEDMKLTRDLHSTRSEITGHRFRAIHNDCVKELTQWPDACTDLIVTSIPFGNQYEYSPSYNDFGHNPDNAAFFRQMDFLVPHLLRVLKPGRLACIHVKDRIRFGNVTGLGMPTVDPFSDDTVASFRKHGFAFMGRITIDTDVVRENNQTYRLGWSENAKDSTKMGVGMPEYVLLFRRLPSDLSDSYADVPVTKDKAIYTRAQWQIDASSFWKSSGNRLPAPEVLLSLTHDAIGRLWRDHAKAHGYDYREHVEIGKALEASGKLPASFMLFPPISNHPGVWTDIARMRVLNSEQGKRNEENHVCLARGSRVLTKERGYIPIEQVKVGEHALTHMGRWKEVEVVSCTGIRPVVTVKAQGVPGLTLTPDHNVWARKSDWVRERDGAERSEPQWIEARESLGTYLNFKLPPEESATIPGDALTWWIVGRWLADGHFGMRNDIHISCGSHEIAGLLQRLGSFAGYVRETHTAHQVSIRAGSSSLREILSRCGSGAGGKHLPPEAFVLDSERAASLLSGYLSGDGHYLSGRNRWMASSISRDLLLGMATIVQRVHGAIASIHIGRGERSSLIEGRSVHCRQEWALSFDVPEARRKQPFVLEDGAWKKVRSHTDAGEQETWCLRVAEDASFTAEGCIVKNCPLQLDIVERLIARYSNPGEIVFDPFAGIFTVPYMALTMGRMGWGTELNAEYWRCGVGYCEQAEAQHGMPTLFDVMAA